MPELSQDSNSPIVAAGAAELGAADAAIQSQNDFAAGSRSDTNASQVGTARDVAFNPAADSTASSTLAGASGVSTLGGAANQGSQAATAAEQWESLADAARGLGWQGDTAQFGDDRQFLLHLLNSSQARQQEDYYAQLGRQLAPHYQGIQNYLGSQGKPGAHQSPAAPAAIPEWEAPEFDDQWMALVQRDPQTGVFLARPGVNPVIADKVNVFDKWQKKYGSNPVAAVRPMLQAELPKMLGDMIRTELGNFRKEQTVNSIVSRNAEWMYQQNNGRPVIGVGGQMVPTPQGMRYGQLVQQLERGGMSDPTSIDGLARQILMGEMAMGQLQQANGQAPAQQQANALASGGAQRNVLQSLGQAGQGLPGHTPQDNTGLSLHEMLSRALETAGYTDADFSDPSKFMN